MSVTVENECYMAGPEHDLLEIYTVLRERHQQDDVVFLFTGQLRWRCESRNGPALKYFKELSQQFPQVTIGWWCWAEWGAYHGCQILAAGVSEWEQFGREVYERDDDNGAGDENTEATELSVLTLYTQTIDLFMTSAACRLGTEYLEAGDDDLASQPEEEDDYEL